jgi:hypothetical protein
LKQHKKTVLVGSVAALALVAAACGGDDDAAAGGDANCPTNLVIQTDWWPESEHGGTYRLIGEGGTSDPKLFTYKGPIDEKYKVAGIETVEIRAGGDAIEFQPVATVMQTDQDIYLGYINTDDAIAAAETVQVTGVAGTLEINPQMLMWDPTQLKIDPEKPETMKASGARVLHFPGVTYIDWMIAKGYLDASQSDPNYGGSPDQWVADSGNYVQQGFATNEIYKYENDISWKDGKPADVEFALIHNLGWQPYPAMYTILTSRLEAERGCLSALVPKIQQAWVDFLADPKPTMDKIIEVTEAYNNYWKLSPGLNDAAVALFKSEGIGGNGSDKTYGNFDEKRIEGLFNELKPILEAKNTALPEGFKASDVFTNEFIDESIGVK